MEISVRQLNVKPSFIKQLLTNGIVLVSHLNTFNALRLSQKTKLKREDCEQILAATKPKRPHYVMKASELMINPFDRISSSLSQLDYILGGGIKCGHVTEISGEAGAGKSNLCAQIGLLAMLPKDKKGLDSHVLLIHTEGEGKLKLAIKRFQTLASSVDDEKLIDVKLDVMNCSSEIQLLEIINRLPEILKVKQSVKLVIIDSITCAFIAVDGNQDYSSYITKSLKLTQLTKMLAHVAWEQRIAILATNHVSYNFKSGENKPAMGKFWSHMCQTKIYLERADRARFAHVTKGAAKVSTPTKFLITNSLPEHSI